LHSFSCSSCLSELGAHGGPTALLAVMAQARHKDPKTSQKYVHTGLHLAKMAREAAEARKTAQATAAAPMEAAERYTRR
jgi:hypothetical protein